MSTFQAGVQYNDFTGTVAADRADSLSMHKYLVQHEHAKTDERIVGYRIGFGGNDGKEIESAGLVVYLCEGDYDPSPRRVRAVEVPMTSAQFFSFFKRFDMVMMQAGATFEEAEVIGPIYE